MQTECERFSNQMLLAMSDELPPDKRQQLEQHLEECSECSKTYTELPLIQAAARRALAVEGPSESIMETIRRRAVQESSKQEAMIFPSVWRIPLAAAALVLMLAGGYVLLMPGKDQLESITREYTIRDMRTFLAFVQDQDNGDGSYYSETEANGSDLRGFAFELLRFQGLDIDEFYDDDYLFDS